METIFSETPESLGQGEGAVNPRHGSKMTRVRRQSDRVLILSMIFFFPYFFLLALLFFWHDF